MNRQQHKHRHDEDHSSPSLPRKKPMIGSAGDKYDVVSRSADSVSFNFFTEASFTETQRRELQRQRAIYNFMAASVPIPPELLVPVSPSPRTNVGLSGNSDLEPWRCRRTDGKKWRCSRDVAAEQKYCERHSHKGRSRSRKPVELNSDFTDKNAINRKACGAVKQRGVDGEEDGLCSFASSGFDNRPRCLDWFIDGGTIPLSTPNQQWSNGFDQSQHCNTFLGSIGETQETIHFIDAWSTPESRKMVHQTCSVSSNGKLPFSSLTLSMSGGDSEIEQMGRESFGETETVSWMNSPPGGPLAEALCLGISSSAKMAPASSPHSTTTSTGKSSPEKNV